ncbi:hypothetical protein [Qaidamihabitans albus]|uniref:hypothetical protein n=1 Tax=Qaidamihabitans albus TaxID=2795733 RepID=UPI0018F112CA|nr:hypothetical protein [Qaidamihabitans albus]
MFAVYCPEHDAEVLLSQRRVKRLVNVEPGVIAVELVCYDGQLLTVLTGARVTEASQAGAARDEAAA